MPVSEIEKYLVSRAMRHFGGSFVSKLGEALTSADARNTATIKKAFPVYWELYRQKGQKQWPDLAKGRNK